MLSTLCSLVRAHRSMTIAVALAAACLAAQGPTFASDQPAEMAFNFENINISMSATAKARNNDAETIDEETLFLRGIGPEGYSYLYQDVETGDPSAASARSHGFAEIAPLAPDSLVIHGALQAYARVFPTGEHSSISSSILASVPLEAPCGGELLFSSLGLFDAAQYDGLTPWNEIVLYARVVKADSEVIFEHQENGVDFDSSSLYELVPLEPGSYRLEIEATASFAINEPGIDHTVLGNVDIHTLYVILFPGPFVQCIGDADGDGIVRFADMPAVLRNYGRNYSRAGSLGDASPDGVVDIHDIRAVLQHMNTDCADLTE